MYLQISSIFGWGVRLGLAGVVVGSAIALGSPTLAQVVPDNTLGGENSLVTPAGEINGTPSDRIDGGAVRGTNLFHSFQQFSIDEGRGAYFSNPTGVENILSRVTGTNASNIFGKLGVLGNANLFLLNPNGIVFGQNAQLDVRGSFVGTTANAIGFGDQGFFSATDPNAPPLLTVNPSAFLFNQARVAAIENNSIAGAGLDPAGNSGYFGLRVPNDKSLLLVGGDLKTDGGGIVAFGGRVDLAAVAGTGTVGLNVNGDKLSLSVPDNLPRADVSLTNEAGFFVRSGGGGDISITAKDISIDNSFLNAGILSNFGSEGAQAGDINLNATSLFINNGGVIRNTTFGLGNAGTINIFARDAVSIDNGNGDSFIYNNVGEGAAGGTGGININTGSLFVKNGAQIQALTRGKGSAGNITITARETVSFDGRGLDDSGPSAAATLVIEGAEGDAGDINITTRILSLSNRAQLLSNTESRGNAGNINIEAREQVSLLNSIILSEVSEEGGVGNGGDINIKTGTLSLKNGSALLADLENQGERAGDIKIEARDAVILEGTGPAPLDLSNIVPNQITSTVDPRNVEIDTGGQGGNVSISTNSLAVTDEGFISTGSFGVGDAGNITITAGDRISLDGDSGVFSFARGGGNGGDIDIKARSLSLTNGAQLRTSSRGTGNAGNIEVQAQDSVSLNNSYLFSNLGSEEETIPASGNVGNIRIKAKTISLTNGAQIQAGFLPNARQQGNPGVVSLEATESISFAGRNNDNQRSGIFTDVEPGAVANGSNIQISAPSVSFNDALLNASSAGQGNAGNIEVQARDSISFDNSFLTSNLGSRQETTPAIGNIGNIRLKARTIAFNNGAELQAGFLPNARQQGNPGVVSLEATDSISFAGSSSSDLEDGSGIFTDVESGAVADGSNIQISAPLISLNDIAVLEASNSGQGNGGDIELQGSKSVRLRNGSQISTSAGGTGQRGDAGNITITSPLVIANFQGNNDIFANAFDGEGGEIKINAQSIIGLRPRTSQELQPELQRLFGTATPTTEQLQAFLGELADNDVAAISLNNPSLSGTVSFNAADIDPSHNIVELPAGLVDASGLVAAGCPSGAENRFAVTGRGGLPPAPGDKLSADALLTDWATLQTPETQNRATAEQTTPETVNTTTTALVEATTWQFGSKGEIILTNADPAALNQFDATPSNCPSS
ncbi:filamentous hemagglutinin N-terminal domain-containing protein [Chroococcidiopsidales cyanobacterium LEGE 13417]|nr:filamentous hemagglutinin N-terminal domain-containing protein [Chroococcidiopsidales cyanobacterium LEGE 13417]